jgi:hypothetical protein
MLVTTVGADGIITSPAESPTGGTEQTLITLQHSAIITGGKHQTDVGMVTEIGLVEYLQVPFDPGFVRSFYRAPTGGMTLPAVEHRQVQWLGRVL